MTSQQRSPEQPSLPAHLDKLLDLPWTLEASKLIDLWLWYTLQEFEVKS